MRVVIIASGSRGDVEPYVALGKGLQAAGHVVRLVTHQDFESLVTSHGLDFWPVAGSVQDVAESMAALIESGNFLAILAQMGKEAQRGALALTSASLAACQGMNLVVAGIGGVFVGVAIAEKLGLPLLQAYYIPFTPTSAYPAFVIPKPPSWLGTLPNRPSYQVARQMMWQAFRSADKRARREVLDLPAAPFFGPFNANCVRNQPIIYGYSPAVIPPPADWGADIHVTGYWFLDPAEDWTPDPALADFLHEGPPPVYVGFGSMSSRKPEETANLILDALARHGAARHHPRRLGRFAVGGSAGFRDDGGRRPLLLALPARCDRRASRRRGDHICRAQGRCAFRGDPLLRRSALLGAARRGSGRWPGADPAQETDGRAAGTGHSSGGDGSGDARARGRAGGENPGGGRDRACRRRRGADETLMPRINADWRGFSLVFF